MGMKSVFFDPNNTKPILEDTHSVYNRFAFTHPNWVYKKLEQKLLKRCFEKYAKGRLLDIGCCDKPYEDMLRPYVQEHIGLDHEGCFHENTKIDIVGTAYDIPAVDGSFDTVLCTQVLEHLENPQKALDEIFRVLKNNNESYAIISVPYLWHLHEQPRDFYRYTPYGIKYLAENAGEGLKLIECHPYGGFITFVTTEIAYCIYCSVNLKVLKPSQIILMNIFLLLGRVFDKIDITRNRLPLGYVCVLKR
jgi:SAM-dependent methyltransferase